MLAFIQRSVQRQYSNVHDVRLIMSLSQLFHDSVVNSHVQRSRTFGSRIGTSTLFDPHPFVHNWNGEDAKEPLTQGLLKRRRMSGEEDYQRHTCMTFRTDISGDSPGIVANALPAVDYFEDHN